jgi:hypothetical protein
MVRSVLVTLVLALAAPTVAAARPAQDSVTGSGSAPAPLESFRIDARSGPSGESPSGQMSFESALVGTLSGRVTCLAVEGAFARLNIQTRTGDVIAIQVLDRAGIPGPDSIQADPTGGRAPDDCSSLRVFLGGDLSAGDIEVVDVQPARPPEDAVTGSGTTDSIVRAFQIDVRSGPSGESPTGGATLDIGAIVGGSATCLAVDGNVAVLNVSIGVPLLPPLLTLRLTDAQPDLLELLVIPGRSATDCSPPTGPSQPARVVTGDIVVVDTEPLPTAKEQCKDDGWRDFGVFGNQGECVRLLTPKR